jgi:hypothetical protein
MTTRRGYWVAVHYPYPAARPAHQRGVRLVHNQHHARVSPLERRQLGWALPGVRLVTWVSDWLHGCQINYMSYWFHSLAVFNWYVDCKIA